MNEFENRSVSVIFTGIPDTAKFVELCREQMPFTIVKVHEQRNLVCLVFEGIETSDPEGYFTSFASYFGNPEITVRVADGNIFE